MVIFYCVPKLIDSLGAASDVNQDYVAKGVSNQTGGQDVQDQMKEMNQTVKDQMTEKEIQNLASLVQSKMKSDGGFSQPELKKMFAKSGLDASPNIAQFNELDKNKNGKLEKAEVGLAAPPASSALPTSTNNTNQGE